MAEKIINIQADEFVRLANKLEKIGRSDLPLAVRGTLNNMSFRMKGSGGQRGQIDKQAEHDFEYRRSKTLMKTITGVSKATGWNINKMQSESGIIKKSGLSEVAEGLADQQTGGSTKQKATPLSSSRTGKRHGRKVRQQFLLKQIESAYKVKRKRGKRFIQLALRAERTGRPIIITGKGGDDYLGFIKRYKRTSRGIDFTFDWKYRFNRDGKVNLKEKHPFIENAAKIVGRGMSKEFVEQANKRINKTFRK